MNTNVKNTLKHYQCNGSIFNSVHIFNYKNINVTYTYIPKNACTTIKKTLGIADGGLNINDDPHNRDGLKTFSANNILNSTKLIVLRNPFKRLVSAFLDKIATPQQQLVGFEGNKNIFKSQGKKEHEINNLIKSNTTATFLEFVQYLSKTPDIYLNEHWRSQSSFFLLDEYDLIFPLERLEQRWNSSILSKYPIIKMDKHTTNFGKEIIHDTNLFGSEDISLLPANVIVTKLKQSKISIDKNLFFKNNEVRELFMDRFADDIFIYKNLFPQLAEEEFFPIYKD
jgi:hypothetical protein